MSFVRHREIYPSDGGQTRTGRAPAHRLDEFPTGYSLAGCSPAEPASASPASLILLRLHSFVYDVSANGNLSLVSVSHRRGAAHGTFPRHHDVAPVSRGRARSSIATDLLPIPAAASPPPPLRPRPHPPPGASCAPPVPPSRQRASCLLRCATARQSGPRL